MEFRKGDKVRLINVDELGSAHSFHYLNERATVINLDIENEMMRVKFDCDGYTANLFPERFELVESKPLNLPYLKYEQKKAQLRFKVGDRVIVIKDISWYGAQLKDKIGTVAFIDHEGKRAYVKFDEPISAKEQGFKTDELIFRIEDIEQYGGLDLPQLKYEKKVQGEFKVGDRVILTTVKKIGGTDMLSCKEYVGKRAEVMKVFEGGRWVTVKFEDGQVATFNPLRLQLVGLVDLPYLKYEQKKARLISEDWDEQPEDMKERTLKEMGVDLEYIKYPFDDLPNDIKTKIVRYIGTEYRRDEPEEAFLGEYIKPGKSDFGFPTLKVKLLDGTIKDLELKDENDLEYMLRTYELEKGDKLEAWWSETEREWHINKIPRITKEEIDRVKYERKKVQHKFELGDRAKLVDVRYEITGDEITSYKPYLNQVGKIVGTSRVQPIDDNLVCIEFDDGNSLVFYAHRLQFQSEPEPLDLPQLKYEKKGEKKMAAQFEDEELGLVSDWWDDMSKLEREYELGEAELDRGLAIYMFDELSDDIKTKIVEYYYSPSKEEDLSIELEDEMGKEEEEL